MGWKPLAQCSTSRGLFLSEASSSELVLRLSCPTMVDSFCLPMTIIDPASDDDFGRYFEATPNPFGNHVAMCFNIQIEVLKAALSRQIHRILDLLYESVSRHEEQACKGVPLPLIPGPALLRHMVQEATPSIDRIKGGVLEEGAVKMIVGKFMREREAIAVEERVVLHSLIYVDGRPVCGEKPVDPVASMEMGNSNNVQTELHVDDELDVNGNGARGPMFLAECICDLPEFTVRQNPWGWNCHT